MQLIPAFSQAVDFDIRPPTVRTCLKSFQRMWAPARASKVPLAALARAQRSAHAHSHAQLASSIRS
eukprot:5689017-Pleurochrysis_carterae.AAC.6